MRCSLFFLLRRSVFFGRMRCCKDFGRMTRAPKRRMAGMASKRKGAKVSAVKEIGILPSLSM